MSERRHKIEIVTTRRVVEMSECVPAWIEIAPFDRKALEASDDGQALLSALDEHFEFIEEAVVDGVPVFRGETGQANYGTDSFIEDIYPRIEKLSLYCVASDEGSYDWDAHRDVHLPDGEDYYFPAKRNGDAVMTYDVWRERSSGSDGTVEEYWADATRDVAHWALKVQEKVKPASIPVVS
jgi:CO dehydrogenase/acetyl-CoA synthase delta subunit